MGGRDAPRRDTDDAPGRRLVDVLRGVVLLVVLWVLAAFKHFEGGAVVIASLWTFLFVVVDLWHPWRPEPAWLKDLWPSKDPDDYR